MQNSMNKALIL